MRSRLLAVLAAAVLMLAACGDDDGDATPDPTDPPGTAADPAQPDPGQAEPAPEPGNGDETVVNVTMSFEPAAVEIAAGDTVRWENSSGLPHTVTSTSGPIDFDESLPDGGSVSVTFDEPGTYEYECTIHPGMTGTVVVS